MNDSQNINSGGRRPVSARGHAPRREVLWIFLWLLVGTQACAQAPRKITVTKDGTGDFASVQQAFNAIPLHNKTPTIVYIQKGVYREKLHLDSTKDFVILVGADRYKTILVFQDHAGMVSPTGDHIGTRESYSFLESADHFTARNLTIRNDAGFSAGQAVALELSGDRAAFIGCRLTGFQDVLFTTNPAGRAYFKDCYIEGTTDFIFGSATALFVGCHIHSKKNSHVTAAATPQGHPFGYVFKDCILTADTTVTNADLGRPWRPYASVTFLHCYLGPHIKRKGWSNWHGTDNDKTARFSEYENFGPGSDTTGRVPWSTQLTDEQAEKFTTANILRGWTPPGTCRGEQLPSTVPIHNPSTANENDRP